MKRSIQNAVCAFAAFFLLATQALAACEDSPRVTGAASAAEKDTMLSQCRSANRGMHETCDAIPACGGGGYPKETKTKFVSQIQICIDKRKAITRTWFAGQGDAGHDAAIDGKINQLTNCLR
jgi:hypothetical protein